jgi:NAD(P)-dependent dehydrogenase (short-subunit alcohol dehydrogenase family)
MEIEGKAALVTGASSGIGRATALRLAAEGADVALVARNRAALEETAVAARKTGRKAIVVPVDVTSAEHCERAVDAAVKGLGKLDILVNAAGIIGSGSISDTMGEDWNAMMRVNLDSVFHLTQLAVPHLKRTRGTIVNVSSVTGTRAFPGLLAYCVSKAAVDQLTRCAALDLAPDGVRVNAINPGVVVTELHRRAGFDEERYAAFLEHSRETHPLGRVGEADEIAESIVWLASPRSGWITGVTLGIDGGRHLTCAR